MTAELTLILILI